MHGDTVDQLKINIKDLNKDLCDYTEYNIKLKKSIESKTSECEYYKKLAEELVKENDRQKYNRDLGVARSLQVQVDQQEVFSINV